MSVPRPLTSMPPPSRMNGRPFARASKRRLPRCARGGFGNAAVLAPIAIFGPGVEVEMHDGRLAAPAGLAADEERAAVAGPAAVGGVHDELDAAQIGAGAAQIAARPSWRRARIRPAYGRSRPGRSCARSRRRPSGWYRAYRASRWGCGARRARWPGASPTRRAWRSRERRGFRVQAADGASVARIIGGARFSLPGSYY